MSQNRMLLQWLSKLMNSQNKLIGKITCNEPCQSVGCAFEHVNF